MGARGMGMRRRTTPAVVPATLVENGLEAALAALAADAEIEVGLTGGLDVALAADIETAAWLVCREAIVNAVAHAGARRVDIHVEIAASRLVVGIVDDGCGGAAMGPAGGLRDVEMGVVALGGTFSVNSPVGEGTTIAACLPAVAAGRSRTAATGRFARVPADPATAPVVLPPAV